MRFVSVFCTMFGLFGPIALAQNIPDYRNNPAWFGPNPENVPCLPARPCNTANTQNVQTQTCPPGTIGIRGLVKTATQEGTKDLLTLICNVCFVEGTYCDGGIQERSATEMSVSVTDPGFFCPVGKWCPNTYTVLDCPAGYYCRAGSSSPQSCFALSICPANSSQPQQYLAYLAVIAFAGTIWLASIVSRQTQLAKAYRERAVTKYVQRHKKQLLAWLASARHNLWMKNGMVGPDPLKHGVVGLEAQAACKAQSFMTFAPLPVNQQITVEVRNLSIQLKSTGADVLRDVTLAFEPGKLHGIFGPSGCGKSSLLTEILGRSDPAALTVSGQVLLNGNAVKLNRIANIVGFVPQDDILPEDLCVHEVLKYSEELRGDLEETQLARRLRVEEVEQLLDIGFVKHSPVGAPDERGISGGQRKRVSIGMELVTRPNILVADELTTGLDATTAFQIMQVLKRLCERTGMTIVVTIHQPRPQIFDLFDNVVVLAGGQVAYQGSPAYTRTYFTNLGFVKSSDSSTPDFLLDVVSGLVPRKDNPAFVPTDLIGEWNDFTETLQQLSAAQLKVYRELQARASQKAAEEMVEVVRRRHDRRTMTSMTIPTPVACMPTTQSPQAGDMVPMPNKPTNPNPFGSTPARQKQGSHGLRNSWSQWINWLIDLQDSFWMNFGMTLLAIFCFMYSLSVYLQHGASANIQDLGALSLGNTTATTNGTTFSVKADTIGAYAAQPIEESRTYLAIPISLALAEGIVSLVLRSLLASRAIKVDGLMRNEHQCDIYQTVTITSLAIMVSMLIGFYFVPTIGLMFGLSCAVLLRPVSWSAVLAKALRKRAFFKVQMKGNHVSSMSGFDSPYLGGNVYNTGTAEKPKEAGRKLLQQIARAMAAPMGRSVSVTSRPSIASPMQVTAHGDGVHAAGTGVEAIVPCTPRRVIHLRSKSGVQRTPSTQDPTPLPNRVPQSTWHQTVVFLKRAVRQEIAHARVLVFLLLLLSGLGIVVGLLFGPNSAFSDLPLKLLLAQICLCLVAAASGMQLFSREKLLYYRERATGTSPLAYFVAKNLVHFPLGEMQPVFFMITYVGLSAPAASFWDQFVVFSVIQFVASGIGMIVAVIFRREAAIAMVCFVMVFVLFNTFNPSLEYFENNMHLGYYGARAAVGWSFARWTSEALFIAELRGYTPANQLRTAHALWKLGYDMDNFVAPNLIVAVLFGFLFRIIAYFILTRTNKAVQGIAPPPHEHHGRRKEALSSSINK